MSARHLVDVQRWAEKATVATQKRNDAISSAYAAGHTLRQIAAEAHLSVEAVRKIVQRTASL